MNIRTEPHLNSQEKSQIFIIERDLIRNVNPSEAIRELLSIFYHLKQKDNPREPTFLGNNLLTTSKSLLDIEQVHICTLSQYVIGFYNGLESLNTVSFPAYIIKRPKDTQSLENKQLWITFEHLEYTETDSLYLQTLIENSCPDLSTIIANSLNTEGIFDLQFEITLVETNSATLDIINEDIDVRQLGYSQNSLESLFQEQIAHSHFANEVRYLKWEDNCVYTQKSGAVNPPMMEWTYFVDYASRKQDKANNNIRIYKSDSETKCTPPDTKKYQYVLMEACTNSNCNTPYTNAIKEDPASTFGEDGRFIVLQMAPESIQPGYYHFFIWFQNKQSGVFVNLGFQEFYIRIINCYDPTSYELPTRPSTCDKMFYSLDTLAPNPYFYFAQCSRFFDIQSQQTTPISCANQTGASAPKMFDYLKYYIIRPDPTPVVKTEGDLLPIVSTSYYLDLTGKILDNDVSPANSVKFDGKLRFHHFFMQCISLDIFKCQLHRTGHTLTYKTTRPTYYPSLILITLLIQH